MKATAAALVLLLLAACLVPRRVTLTDSQGRQFVRVREMAPAGTPPLFTQAQ